MQKKRNGSERKRWLASRCLEPGFFAASWLFDLAAGVSFTFSVSRSVPVYLLLSITFSFCFISSFLLFRFAHLFSFVLVRQFITSLYSFPFFLLFGFLFQSVLLLSFCLPRIFGFVLSFLPVCPLRYSRLNVLENVQPRLMIGRPPRLPHRLSASVLFLFPRSFVRPLSLDSFSIFSFFSSFLSVCSVVVALFLFCVIPWFLCTLNFVD